MNINEIKDKIKYHEEEILKHQKEILNLNMKISELNILSHLRELDNIFIFSDIPHNDLENILNKNFTTKKITKTIHILESNYGYQKLNMDESYFYDKYDIEDRLEKLFKKYDKIISNPDIDFVKLSNNKFNEMQFYKYLVNELPSTTLIYDEIVDHNGAFSYNTIHEIDITLLQIQSTGNVDDNDDSVNDIDNIKVICHLDNPGYYKIKNSVCRG